MITLASVFADSPEYEQRKKTPFSPTKVSLTEIHAAIPKEFYKKNTLKGLFYALRDVFCAVVLYHLAWGIDPFATALATYGLPTNAVTTLRWSLWIGYWYCQGIVLAGWWCLAHEAGHGTVSPYNFVNHAVGFSLHSFLLTPYFAWRSTHHSHHKAAMSVERDENYVPRVRSDLGLPPKAVAKVSDYHELFEETPLYTLLRMLIMQLLGWHYYLVANAMGSPRYPPGTNHFSPSSPLFKERERNKIIASNIALVAMTAILYRWTQTVGSAAFVKLYFIPYLLVNHWIVMLTFLHHSDPTIPYYRKNEWSFLRGALATVDRPLLGWAGRFFFHNVSHDHIAHHLFSSIPWYNQPKVTERLKEILKGDYNYDSTNSFRALYRSFTECCFIEDEGDIVFYMNMNGQTARSLEVKEGSDE
ncbi:delta-12 fatty acid desaturase [Moniliophthora roreri MCA 2997]|uniref:Delta-12 fatty acid desaturase n=2 Tax=Moniliophthora roreri TaxID=221103 RepID=V2WHB7_MONRO|nr:delta-12 fatty acid desaturase [Moniliophthora roreri MCA 2997]KAI3615616.1 delta-12 fatty acid desaturase [Moniliophthora roreri]